MNSDVIIFLDIEGVIYPGLPFVVVPFTAVNRLEAILTEFPECQIVISSDLRKRHGLSELKRFFSAGIAARIIGVTPVIQLSTYFWRQREIEQYLGDADQVTDSWIALDDNPKYFSPHSPNVILCNPLRGIDEQIEMQVRSKLTEFRTLNNAHESKKDFGMAPRASFAG
jgi:hypothetical protein